MCIAILIAGVAGKVSAESVLRVNLRNRPPDIHLKDGGGSGPLKEILEKAASRIDTEIQWIEGPFKRGLEDMRNGKIDLVPRTFFRKDRLEFTHYLKPIGYQKKEIVFFVKKGRESVLKNYDDLYKIDVGVKRGTVYFPQFDNDDHLRKIEGAEDPSLVKMLIGERFDAVISIDEKGMKEEFKKLGYDDYSLADYKFVKKIGLYYASSKVLYNSGKKKLYTALDDELQKMVSNGEVDMIYRDCGAPIPLH